jgi:hypothetical protein
MFGAIVTTTLIEHGQRPLEDVEVPVRDRVEGAGVDRDGAGLRHGAGTS